MPPGREPAKRVVSPLEWRSCANSVSRRWRVIGPSLVLAAACSGRGDGATGGTQRPNGGGPEGPQNPWSGVGHVGNQVRGIDAIPDYDQEAQYLRDRVEPQLPDPLPSPQAACVTMLDAARRFYVDTEGEDSTAVATMARTREADLGACVEHTAPAAATCVAVLMAQSEGEFPWVLDQCSRAYPKTAG